MSKRGYVPAVNHNIRRPIGCGPRTWKEIPANKFFSNSRGGASGNKLKMTLGLPVYVPPEFATPDTPNFPVTFVGLAHRSSYSVESENTGREK